MSTIYTQETLNTMTNKDLMAVLNQLGGTFNKKASKATLIAGILALQEKAQQEAPEEPKTEAPETAETVHVAFTLKDNSVAPTEDQLALLTEIPAGWEVRVWSCNHNMITCYYRGVQAIEIMSSRTPRISTRTDFAVPGMTTRKSGYGMDATVVCPAEDVNGSRTSYVRLLVSNITRAVDAKKASKKEAKKEEA